MPIRDGDIGSDRKLQHEADDPQNHPIMPISVRILYLHACPCAIYCELEDEEDVLVEPESCEVLSVDEEDESDPSDELLSDDESVVVEELEALLLATSCESAAAMSSAVASWSSVSEVITRTSS